MRTFSFVFFKVSSTLSRPCLTACPTPLTSAVLFFSALIFISSSAASTFRLWVFSCSMVRALDSLMARVSATRAITLDSLTSSASRACWILISIAWQALLFCWWICRFCCTSPSRSASFCFMAASSSEDSAECNCLFRICSFLAATSIWKNVILFFSIIYKQAVNFRFKIH